MTTNINLRKGLCPVCRRWIPLTKGGRLRAHHPHGATCGGIKPSTKMRLFVAEVEFRIRRKTP